MVRPAPFLNDNNSSYPELTRLLGAPVVGAPIGERVAWLLALAGELDSLGLNDADTAAEQLRDDALGLIRDMATQVAGGGQ